MKNIILIGMPDSGKSSVGREIARILNRKFFDTDIEIERIYNKSPKEIFSERGEDAFREIEIEVCSEVCKNTDCVISTGGGVVTREQNYNVLKESGIVYLLNRHKIELDRKRPLLLKYKNANRIWEDRKEMYFRFADVIIDKDENEDAVFKIIEHFESILKEGSNGL